MVDFRYGYRLPALLFTHNIIYNIFVQIREHAYKCPEEYNSENFGVILGRY